MAEGFSSLADLKIVVDATTDRLNENLSLAKNTIHRFAADGNTSLKGFDANLEKLGGTAQSAREKFGAFTVGMQIVQAQLQEVNAMIAARAGEAGIGDEYGKVATELSDLASSVLPGVTAGAAAAARSMFGLAEGASASGAAVEEANPHLKIMAETVSEGLVNNIRELTHSFKRLMSRETWSPDTAARELEWLERRAAETVERIDKIAADGPSFFTQIFGGDEAAAAIRELQTVTDQYEKAIQQRADAIERERLAKIAAREALGDATYEDTVEGLQKEVTALERKAAVLGMTKGEAAAYAAVMQVVDALVKNGAELTEHAAENLAELTDRFKELSDAADGFAKGEQATKFIEGLSRQIRDLNQQSAGLTRTGAALAAYTAEQRIRNQVEDQGLQLSDQQRAKMEAAISTIKSKTVAHHDEKKAIDDARNADKSFEGAVQKLQRETAGLKEKAQALIDSSDAGKIKARVDRELADLAARNISLSGQRVAKLQAEVTAQVEAQRAVADMQAQMASVREAGQVVSRSLEGAFARWTEGSKINVKEMVRSMLADLAQLAFKKGVIDSLFGGGGGAGGGAGGGGLLGTLFSSVIGAAAGGGGGIGPWNTTTIPARADGGPVSMGQTYLVGERGPELFVPGGSGSIVSNRDLEGFGRRDGGGRAGGEVMVTVAAGPELLVTIDNRAEGVVSRAAPQIVSSAVATTNKALPGMINGVQKRKL